MRRAQAVESVKSRVGGHREPLAVTVRKALPNGADKIAGWGRPPRHRRGGRRWDYRFRLVSSLSISSAVVITRAFAWKPLCEMIILVNSSARFTLELSRAPEVMLD